MSFIELKLRNKTTLAGRAAPCRNAGAVILLAKESQDDCAVSKLSHRLIEWPRKGGDVMEEVNLEELLQVAIEEAQQGSSEGGIPIGAALFDANGNLLGRGHNRRVQQGDPSMHAETDAFRNAGRQLSYKHTIMATTLAPCWYCSGLVRQFKIGTVVVGESATFKGGIDWLRDNGVRVVDLQSDVCRTMLNDYITAHPEIWNEDIGE